MQGSGLDIACSCFGGLIRFVKKKGFQFPSVINCKKNMDTLNILYVFTGYSQNTNHFLDKILKAKTKLKESYFEIISILRNKVL